MGARSLSLLACCVAAKLEALLTALALLGEAWACVRTSGADPHVRMCALSRPRSRLIQLEGSSSRAEWVGVTLGTVRMCVRACALTCTPHRQSQGLRWWMTSCTSILLLQCETPGPLIRTYERTELPPHCTLRGWDACGPALVRRTRRLAGRRTMFAVPSGASWVSESLRIPDEPFRMICHAFAKGEDFCRLDIA